MAENSKIEGKKKSWYVKVGFNPLTTEKTAAIRIGISLEEYRARTASGLKWCRYCREWHSKNEFPIDSTRGDGLASLCTEARRKERKGRQRSPEPVEKRRARRLVQSRVRRGTLVDPKSLKCMDCGHKGDDRRHEYDHYLGYATEHHASVQAVCSRCHSQREKARKNGRAN